MISRETGDPTQQYFYYSLAETLGKTLSELFETLDSQEVTDWMAYFKTKHFLENRAQQMAQAKAKRRL
jgi:hypothetical protein